MRKYLYIILLALLSWHSAIGKVVPEDKAREIAAKFYSQADVHTRSAVQPSDFRLVCSYPIPGTRSDVMDPAIYVFERLSGGYVVVSGDDVARPVLGYSLEDRFPSENMPDNMRSLLQWYSDIIVYARFQGLESSPASSTKADLDPANSKVLKTVSWAQGTPFNDLAPEIEGQKPPIGCLATAISIIMRYHKWPEKGTGTLPSYEYRHGKIDGITLGHEYDWEKMPDDYRNCGQEEAAQIARLLYDVAVMCKMDFDLKGSGANTFGVTKLIDHFYYDKGIRYSYRDVYPDPDRWEQIIREEIDADRPVLYTGYTEDDDGHALVIDGYNGSYFSMNYGWGRNSTIFNTLTPIEGHQEDLTKFYKYQEVYYRIMPDKGQGESSEPDIFADGNYPAWLPVDFATGKNSSIRIKFTSDSFQGCEREIRLELRDRNNRLKEVVSSTNTVTISRYEGMINRLQYKVTSSISEGDYLVFAIKNPESGEWKEVLSSRKSIIVFTTRKLSELVEIGYFEPDMSIAESRGILDVFVKFYKDICWELFKKNESTSLFNVSYYSRREVYTYFYDKYDWGSLYQGFVNPDDPDCDTVIMKLGLPSGSYVLRFNNPATGEKLDIKLEL